MLNKDKFIIEMIYHSCAIEGNSMAFEDTTMVYNNQELNLYYNGREFNEIENHFDAIELMLSYVNQKEILSNRVIKDMHFELCKNILRECSEPQKSLIFGVHYIIDYIDYYNLVRKKRKLKSKTPVEYRNLALMKVA